MSHRIHLPFPLVIQASPGTKSIFIALATILHMYIILNQATEAIKTNLQIFSQKIGPPIGTVDYTGIFTERFNSNPSYNRSHIMQPIFTHFSYQVHYQKLHYYKITKNKSRKDSLQDRTSNHTTLLNRMNPRTRPLISLPSLLQFKLFHDES